MEPLELWIEMARVICRRASNHDDVPMLQKLSSLKFYDELRLWPIWVVWDAIQLLLCRAPELQTLTFELTHRCRAQCSGPDKRLKPLDVPECMSSHLTTIHYKGFSEYEMELVEQILKEANVLKDNENHC